MEINREVRPLEDLIDIRPRNGLYKSKEFQGRGHRWIKMSEVYGNDFLVDQETEFIEVTNRELERFGCLEGDLLFGRTSLTLEGIGSCLLVGPVTDVPVFESNLFRIRFNKSKADPRFYFYFFKSPYGRSLIQTIAKQTAATSITATDLIKLYVPVPSLEEQKEIAEKLSDFDHKIDLNRRTNQTLEQIAQTLFKSWFMDFDPVCAKVTVREHFERRAAEQSEPLPQPAALEQAQNTAAAATITGLTFDPADIDGTRALLEAKLAGMDAEQRAQLMETAAQFPAAMVDNEQGEIPQGWTSSTIGDEVEIVGGATPSTKNEEFWEGGIHHWTTPKDLSGLNDKILLDTERKITDAGLAKISSGLLPVDTVLMSSRAPVGYLALTKVPVAVNQGYIAMICTKRLSPEYVLLWAEYSMARIKNRASGTTFAEISKKNFRPIPVIVPDSEVITRFCEVARSLYNKIEAGMRESNQLASVRDILLPKLLSGEIQPNPEPIAEAS